MKPISTLCLASFALLLAPGCASKKDETIWSISKNVVGGWPKGRQLDPEDVSRVREPEHIHAYHVGRLPSKDRRSMAEAHTVYRKEQDARWDQRLPATPMDSRGPIFGIREPATRPVPESDLVRTEVQRQRQLSEKLQTSQERITGMESTLRAKIAQFEDSSKTFDDVRTRLDTTLAEKRALETQLAESEAELKKAKGDLEAARMENDSLREKGGSDLLDSFGRPNFSEPNPAPDTGKPGKKP
ncbi:MAG: hypothetical protein KDM91_19060 [Verrucomicrobiae bacterium]|nr:hypothetical protein [Verrucomicrobiae bacterium]MCP5551655.1 hypothetical protein [Akkermansiaceae bacterium]